MIVKSERNVGEPTGGLLIDVINDIDLSLSKCVLLVYFLVDLGSSRVQGSLSVCAPNRVINRWVCNALSIGHYIYIHNKDPLQLFEKSRVVNPNLFSL